MERDAGSDMKDFVDILLRLQKDDLLDFEFTPNDMKAILLVSLSLHTNFFYLSFSALIRVR